MLFKNLRLAARALARLPSLTSLTFAALTFAAFAASTTVAGCAGDDEQPGSGATCGGFVGVGCADSEYCDYDHQSCEVNDGSGACKARPQACNDDYMPVRGSDGQIYSNACKANLAGVDDCGPAT